MSLFERLLPRSRREWGRAYVNESGHTEDSGLGWLAGGVQFILWSWIDWTLGGNEMKTVLATLSAVTLALGMFVIGLFLVTDANPALVLILGIGLVTQGAYTLWHMTESRHRHEPWATRLLLSGATVALLVGTMGFLATTINTLVNAGPGADPEFGPMMVGLVIATQAAAVLYSHVITQEASPEARLS